MAATSYIYNGVNYDQADPVNGWVVFTVHFQSGDVRIALPATNDPADNTACIESVIDTTLNPPTPQPRHLHGGS